MKKVMLLSLLLFSLALSGCQKAAESPTDFADKVTIDSPFNTLTDTEEWGDESDFLRIVDMTDDLDAIHATEFEGERFALTDERFYGFVMYVHNTSDEDQKEVTLMLSYPRLISIGNENQANAMLSWGGDAAGIIGDTLNLEVQTNIYLPLADEEQSTALIVNTSDTSKSQALPVLTADMDGMMTHFIQLDSLTSGEACTVFLPVEALPTFQR